MQIDDLNQYCFFLVLVISQFSSVFQSLFWADLNKGGRSLWWTMEIPQSFLRTNVCFIQLCVLPAPQRMKATEEQPILARFWHLGLFHFGTWLCSFIIQETICRMSQISAYLNNLIRLMFFPNGQRFLLISVPSFTCFYVFNCQLISDTGFCISYYIGLLKLIWTFLEILKFSWFVTCKCESYIGLSSNIT